MAMNLAKLLKEMEEKNASDLHLKVGSEPLYRIDGRLASTEHPTVSKDDLAAVVDKIVPEKIKPQIETIGAVDFAFSIDKDTRFRTNVFLQRGLLSMSLRRLNSDQLGFEKLNLPPIVHKIATLRRGMVVVTGPTGTGKSTTVASMVDFINSTRKEHIITIEDPIEFLHRDKLSLIDQREIGLDAPSFDLALRHAMREDPDVIVVGEMRDRETIVIATRASMTGHLVITTFHTINAVHTITRILNYFRPEEQAAMREELTVALKAVLSQRLVPMAGDKGRVPILEIMIVNDLVKKMIRENREADIERIIQNRDSGMQTFDHSLADLINKNLISFETGVAEAENVSTFKRLAAGHTAGDDRATIVGKM